jgi:FlaA1/EpsC-like NDP-sugar epimerase
MYMKNRKHFLHLIWSVFVDVLIVFVILSLCFVASFYGWSLEASQYWGLLIFTASFALVLCLTFGLFGIYRLLTDNFGMYEAGKVALIVFIVNVIGYIVLMCLPNDLLPKVNVAAYFLSVVAMVLACDGARVARRTWNYWASLWRKRNVPKKRTLIIGAGQAAKIVLDDSRGNPKAHNEIVIILDDDPNKIGRTFSGIPVVGPVSGVANFVKLYQIDQVIIAIQSLTKDRLNEIIGYLRDVDVELRRLPILSELGSVNSRTILKVDINEILGRPQVQLDNSEITGMLQGKTVLVTGAGGSIGSELVRQIYKTKPATLILFDIYENGVYDIQQELVRQMRREGNKDLKLVTLIGSTYNEVRMEQVFMQYKPDYIYHAAAYKHVPLMEESPVEAVRTNVLGTYNVAKLADKYHATKMLLISTDKAVRPTNAMGATKRFAEMIIQYFAANSKTKYCAVRFGNVLGSNGSVIPLFAKQIEEGGPITVTDPNIIRYFMTIPEAVGLILQSSMYAQGGEIFILDMGKPMKIDDVARKMIRQAGYIPGKDIKIIYSGLRPGEKLYEETLLNPENQTKTANQRIFVEKPEETNFTPVEIERIGVAFNLKESPNEIKELIRSVVKTYAPEMDD